MEFDEGIEDSKGVPFDRKPNMSFKEGITYWPTSKIRIFINGCHKSKDYDYLFDIACRELNNRKDN